MIEIEQLVEAGVHFGHRTRRWNPKMAPFIYGKRNLIHIIDLVSTVRGLARSQRFLTNLVAAGHKVVIVGTKRQIRTVVASEAKRCSMPYVNERWLGGTLTNFATVRSRLKRLEKLEEMESTGKMAELPKKAQSFLQRELRRIRRNLDGIRDMDQLPGALLVIDSRKEYIAVNEANRLGIPIVAVLDTDCDPSKVDIAIPGNDDAMRSVETLLKPLVNSIIDGKSRATTLAEEARKAKVAAKKVAAAAADEAKAKAAANAKAKADAAAAQGQPAAGGEPA